MNIRKGGEANKKRKEGMRKGNAKDKLVYGTLICVCLFVLLFRYLHNALSLMCVFLLRSDYFVRRGKVRKRRLLSVKKLRSGGGGLHL